MSEQPDPRRWRRTAGSRLIVLGVVFAVWSVAVFARLVDLQIFQRAELEARAESQRTNLLEEPAQRGDLLDRNGNVLAYSVDVDTVCAVPSKLEDPTQVAARACDALGDCDDAERAAITKRLSRKSAFAYVRRRVSVDQARRVAALKIDGIHFIKEPRRYYPNRELAAHVLGYVGSENKGLAGLEATYDSKLRGRPGHILLQSDGRKTGRRPFSRVGDPPVPGVTIELTIDETLQHLAERELKAGVEENKAAGGSVVIMDPMSGEIFALANYPTFNPNSYGMFPPEQQRNRGVQDVYEPGSTFKIVTASAALEEKILRPNDVIDTGGGVIAIGSSRTVRDTHAYGALSFTDVIVKSSNIGAIKIGLRLGAERLGRYVQRFGFGTRLSPDFPGESAGIVWRPAQWNESTLASVSMGYEIGVTPLQMAVAASTVANGGELVQPRVVRALIDGGTRTVVPRKVVRRVTTAETTAEMTTIMEGVVERGTATLAKLPDFTIAGKTGTSNKNVDGHYLNQFNASFVGFVPSRKPALTILVMIDSPHSVNGHFGGRVSAPIFQRIADAALRYLGVTPTINPAPPVLVPYRGTGNEIRVAGPAVPLTIIPAANHSSTGQVVLPELRGLSGREALRVLARLGITPRVAGEGIVIEQVPLPGTALEAGGACRLALGRPTPGLHP
jgi:cell division protein FtsI (penicillin-binding protein 3)